MKKKLELKKETVVLLDHSAQNQVIGGKNMAQWMCRMCGYIYEGPEAPHKCMTCSHIHDSFIQV